MGRSREWRTLLLAVVVGGLVTCGLAVASGSPASAGPPTVETTTRYEAEDYPGTVGSNTTDATCSGTGRRGSAMTTGPLVSIPVSVPADVLTFRVRAHGRTASSSSPAFSLSGGWDGTISAPVNASGTCDVHSDFSLWSPYPVTGGERTLTITPAGGIALTLDYVEVIIVTPEPTTTTTTESTTTTTESTTTTTIEVPEPGEFPAGASWKWLLVWLFLTLGVLCGNGLWGRR